MRQIRLWTVLALAAGAAACGNGAGRASDTGAAPAVVVSGLDLEAADRRVRPQDDPFQHVNGAWLAATPIPADKSSYGSFDRLDDKAQADLRAIVEETARADGAGPGSDAQKIAHFYQSFMDEARVEQTGLQPLQAEFAAIDRIRTRRDLARYFARMFTLRLVNPVGGYVDGDARRPDVDTLYLLQGGLGLPDREYYSGDDRALRSYRERYLGLLTALLTEAKQPAPEATAREILELETRLARAHWTNVESRDAVKTYNPHAVADLPAAFPGFDWAAWSADLGLTTSQTVVVSQPSYFTAFAALVEELPVDRWKPYLRASLLNGFAPYLHQAMVDAEFDFYGHTLRGVEVNEPRWKRGVTVVNANLGEMLGKLYVERHFKPEARARMGELVENLRRAFGDGIDGLDWMGPDTRKQAREKLARFRPKVGYPVKWRDYSDVETRPDDLIGNLTRAYLAEHAYQIGKVGKPIDPDEWGMTPQTVNAYYNPVRNEIVFPAAILQPPFFDLAADDAVNYGAIGAVIGHEMGHGFDDQGRRYDAAGVLRDWWAPADADAYMSRAARVVEQYNQFEPLPGLRVNGELTLGENLGDLTGVLIAHRAYRLSLDGREAPVIDGMTGDQRFFFGWVQAWRAKRRDDALRQQVLTDPHAPERFRANGPLRNVPAFYDAFGVKEGDAMYLKPEDRIRLW